MITMFKNIMQSIPMFFAACASMLFFLYYLMRLDDDHIQAYIVIRRCISACAESNMVQVHTENGCYCLDQEISPQPFWEPGTKKQERIHISEQLK